MIAHVVEGVKAHLNALDVYVNSGDTANALKEAEDAKRLLQELYYEVWMRHHTSGTGGAK